MKRLSALIFTTLISLISFSQASANCCSNYLCQNNTCCCPIQGCGVQIAAEWLYMHFGIDEPYYALLPDSGGLALGSERVANLGRWHSGFRLDGLYALLNCDYLRARWTGLYNLSNSDKIDAINFPVHGVPFFNDIAELNASSFNKIQFDYLDALYGKKVYCCCPVTLWIEGGLQYLSLHFKEHLAYEPFFRVRNHSNWQGVGPEVALLIDYRLFNSCFSIVSRTASSFLVSHKEAKFNEIFDDIELGFISVARTRNKHYWSTQLMLNFRIGLDYWTRCNLCWCGCGCFGLEFQIGYEFIHLAKAIDRIYFVDFTAFGQSFTENIDFTLHGPYARLGISF